MVEGVNVAERGEGSKRDDGQSEGGVYVCGLG